MEVLVILVPDAKTLEPNVLDTIAAAKLLGPVSILIAGIHHQPLAAQLEESKLVKQVIVTHGKTDNVDRLAQKIFQKIQSDYSDYQAVLFPKNTFGRKFKTLIEDFPALAEVNHTMNLPEEQRVKIQKDAFELKTKLIPHSKIPPLFITPEVETSESPSPEMPESPQFKKFSGKISPEHIRKMKKRALSTPLPAMVTLPKSRDRLSMESADLSDQWELEIDEVDIKSETPKKPEKHQKWQKFQTLISDKLSKIRNKPAKLKNSYHKIEEPALDPIRQRSKSIDCVLPRTDTFHSACDSSSEDSPYEVYIWNEHTAAVVTDELGEGCFGSVTRTMEIDLKAGKVIPRSRAVKIFNPGSPPPGPQKRRSDEYRMSAALYGSYGSIRNSIDDTSAFDMPYLEGQNLFSLLEKFYEPKADVYDFKFRIRLIIEICRALAEFQNVGVVHKDFKPENIIFDPRTHKVRICDFGFAITVNSANTDHSGSPDYVSPEVLWADEPATAASDIFAVGIIIPMILGGAGTTNNMWLKAQKLQVRCDENMIRSSLRFVNSYLEKNTTDHAEIIIRQIISLLSPEPLKRPSATDCAQFFTEIYNQICLPEEVESIIEKPFRTSSPGFFEFVQPRIMEGSNFTDTPTVQPGSNIRL